MAPRGINDPWLPDVEQLAGKLLSRSSNVLKAGAQKPAPGDCRFFPILEQLLRSEVIVGLNRRKPCSKPLIWQARC